MILKKRHLDKEVKDAIKIIYILLNKEKISIFKIAQIMYKLYENNSNNKKLLKELLLAILRSIKKLLKELIVLIIISNLIKRIKNFYKEDEIL